MPSGTAPFFATSVLLPDVWIQVNFENDAFIGIVSETNMKKTPHKF